MINKLKGILASTAVVIAAFYIWGLLGNQTVDPSPAIMIGGVLGAICGAAIAFIKDGTAPVAVGVGAMLVVWGVVAALLIGTFGTEGLDLVKALVTTLVVAAIGGASGQAYKVATANSAPGSIGD